MRTPFLPTLLLATACAAAAGVRSAPDGLSDALAARSLLGPGTWARVVRIDNSGAPGVGPRKPYPSVVYALVFELSGILWFYCDADGTQSLSLRRGALDADKADPGPLFRAICERFGAWAWVDEAPAWPAARAANPPNACFLECMAALRRRVAGGFEAEAPRLLSYYVDTPVGRLGHTVILFGTRGGQAALDPERSDRTVMLPDSLGPDPRSLARYLRGGEVAAARMLPVGGESRLATSGRWAALPSNASPAG